MPSIVFVEVELTFGIYTYIYILNYKSHKRDFIKTTFIIIYTRKTYEF